MTLSKEELAQARSEVIEGMVNWIRGLANLPGGGPLADNAMRLVKEWEALQPREVRVLILKSQQIEVTMIVPPHIEDIRDIPIHELGGDVEVIEESPYDDGEWMKVVRVL